MISATNHRGSQWGAWRGQRGGGAAAASASGGRRAMDEAGVMTLGWSRGGWHDMETMMTVSRSLTRDPLTSAWCLR
jgi:hypothetical protein